jgi:hypothetical protein
MKTLVKWALVLPLTASLGMQSCSKEEDNPSPKPKSPVEGKELIFAGQSIDADIDVKVYADEPLFVGYNRLYVMAYQLGTSNIIKDAHVTFVPEMSMMTGMTHGCPVESPEEVVTSDGVFEGVVVFVMPSGGGTWKLGVQVHNHINNIDGLVESEVTVVSPGDVRLYSCLSQVDSTSIFISLVKPLMPDVGKNDFELVVHQKLSMMDWPFVSGLSVEITPEMPTMGHGSPDNVNPVYTSMGHYANGTVNYTMNGLWYVNIVVKDANGDVVDDAGRFEQTL